MTLRVLALLVMVLCGAAALWADLNQAKAEPNLEKRSKLALENAQQALKAARQVYASGDTAKLQALLTEVRDSVQLAADSLNQTGKNPRKSPKHFKRAEIETRDLLRRLDAFRDEMSVMDRHLLEPVRAKVQQVHDDLLMGIMEGKRK